MAKRATEHLPRCAALIPRAHSDWYNALLSLKQILTRRCYCYCDPTYTSYRTKFACWAEEGTRLG